MFKPKLLILGYARHGKDTVCELLSTNYGFSFISSSLFCAEEVIYPVLKDKYGYKDVGECFEDRSNHRAEWYDEIGKYNRFDPTRLGRAILSQYDIYCGLRRASEFHAMRNAGVFDLSIWVDRSEVLSSEDRSSCTVEPWMADYVLDNNGTLEDLLRNLDSLLLTHIIKFTEEDPV